MKNNNSGYSPQMEEYIRKRNALLEKEKQEVIEGAYMDMSMKIPFNLNPTKDNCYIGKGTWTGAETVDLNKEE